MHYTREYIILLASRSMHNTTLECILCAYSTLLASMHNMHIIVLIEQQYTTQQYAQCAYYSRGMHTLELCILQETLEQQYYYQSMHTVLPLLVLLYYQLVCSSSIVAVRRVCILYAQQYQLVVLCYQLVPGGIILLLASQQCAGKGDGNPVAD